MANGKNGNGKKGQVKITGVDKATADAAHRAAAEDPKVAVVKAEPEQHTHLATPAEEAAEKKARAKEAAKVPAGEQTPRQKRDELEKQFNEADEKGKAEITDNVRKAGAALGGGF